MTERECAAVVEASRGRSSVSNLSYWYRLVGRLDVEALQASVGEVVARHEALRLVLRRSMLRVRKSVAPEAHVPWTHVDLTRHPAKTRLAEAERLCTDDLYTPFDLSQGSLMRVLLVRLGSDSHVLSLNTHHLATDAWSGAVLLREISAVYNGMVAGQPVELPPVRVGYFDYLGWRTQDKDGAIARQRRYWEQELRGATLVPNFAPADAGPYRHSAGEAVGINHAADAPEREWARIETPEIRRSTAEKLREGWAAQQATTFMGALAMFEAIIFRYTGAGDLLVEIMSANRYRRELLDLVGYLAVPLGLRTHVTAGMEFTDLLGHVKAKTVDAMANQEGGRWDGETGAVRQASGADALSLAFQYQAALGATDTALTLDGVRAEPFGSISFHTWKDLALRAWETAQGAIRASITFDRAKIDSAVVNRMAGQWCAVAAAVAEDPSIRLDRLPLLTPREARRLAPRPRSAPTGGGMVEQRLSEALRRLPPRHVVAATAASEWTTEDVRAADVVVGKALAEAGMAPDLAVAIVTDDPGAAAAASLSMLSRGRHFTVLDAHDGQRKVEARLAAVGAHVRLDVHPQHDDDRPVLVARAMAVRGDRPAASRAWAGRGGIAYSLVSGRGSGWHVDRVPDSAVAYLLDRGLGPLFRGGEAIGAPFDTESEAFLFTVALSACRRGRAVLFDHGSRNRSAPGLIERHAVTAAVVDAEEAVRLARRGDLQHLRALVAVSGQEDDNELRARVADIGIPNVALVHGPPRGANLSGCNFVGVPAATRFPTGMYTAERHVVLDGTGEIAPVGVAGRLHLVGAATSWADDDGVTPFPVPGSGEIALRATSWRARILDGDEIQLVGPIEEHRARRRRGRR